MVWFSLDSFLDSKYNLLELFHILLYLSLYCRLEQKKNIMKLVLPFHVNKVGAGFPSPATDYVEDDIDLNAHLIKNIPSTFLIRVQGKSMSNIGIRDGDLLVVDKSLNPKNFYIIFFYYFFYFKIWLSHFYS